MHVNRHKCLNLGSDELASNVTKTHLLENFHNCVNFSKIGFEGIFAIFLLSLKSLSDLRGPENLNTEKSELRLVLIHEFLEIHV